VVDAEHGGFRKHRLERLVERACGGQVVAERLLDDDPGAGGTAGRVQLSDDGAEQARRDREVVCGRLGVAERRAESGERGRIPIVSVDVPQQRQEGGKGRLVDATAVFLQARARPVVQLLDRPARPGHPDNRSGEVVTLDHALQRGEDLLVGEVARGAEEDQRVRFDRPSLDGCHISIWPS
jgi:hypothetical protein